MAEKKKKQTQKQAQRDKKLTSGQKLLDADKREKVDFTKKMTIGQEFRALNVMFPWFKLVAGAMVVMLVVVLGIGVTRHEWLRQANEEEEVALTGDDEMVSGAKSVDRGEVVQQTEVKKVALPMQRYIKTRAEFAVKVNYEGKKLIALSFDDGPSRGTTLRLLDILQEKQAKASFFVVGRMAQAAPEVLQREEKEGHFVGSHSMSHVNLAGVDEGTLQREVAEMDTVFTGILGHQVQLTRPPYGMINDLVRTKVGQPLVIWSIDPEDWKVKDAEAVRKHVIERAFDGAIVLMHDIYNSTVNAIPGMIDELRREGYEFVTVPQMAKLRGVKMEQGEVYGSFRI